MYHQTSFTEVWMSIWHLFGEMNCKVCIHMFATCERSILNRGCTHGDGKLNHTSLIKKYIELKNGTAQWKILGYFLTETVQNTATASKAELVGPSVSLLQRGGIVVPELESYQARDMIL